MDAFDREQTRKSSQAPRTPHAPSTRKSTLATSTINRASSPSGSHFAAPTERRPAASDISQASTSRHLVPEQRSPVNSGRLPAPVNPRLPATINQLADDANKPMLITPDRALAKTTPMGLAKAGSAPVLSRNMRFIAVVLSVAAVLTTALAFNVLHSSTPTSARVGDAVPPPSGRGPLTAMAGAIVYAPAPQSVHNNQTVSVDQPQSVTNAGGTFIAKGQLGMEPCQDSYKFVPNISNWTTPPGCYANIYVPNRANYIQAASWGYCNWWVEVTHPQAPDITYGPYPRGNTPVAGAAIYFDGGEQGADSAGHFAETVAVSPDGYWVLISEMNFAWRGGGFGKIDYRYIHVSPHVHFMYNV